MSPTCPSPIAKTHSENNLLSSISACDAPLSSLYIINVGAPVMPKNGLL